MMEPTLRNVSKTHPVERLLAGFALALLVVATAAGLLRVPGEMIFYSTYGWHAYLAHHDQAERRAAHERRYAPFRRAPQPRRTGANLPVERDPAGRRTRVRGTYHPLNRSGLPIDTIGLLACPGRAASRPRN